MPEFRNQEQIMRRTELSSLPGIKIDWQVESEKTNLLPESIFIKAIRVTILLPAYNEARTIQATIEEVRRYLPQARVIVIDNASNDGTGAIAASTGAEVLSEPRKGKGNAIRTGLKAVQTDYCIMLDSDHTYPARYIPIVIAYLQDGADIVMGYRKVISPKAMPQINRLGNRGLSLLASSLYGIWICDVCTGLWGFTPRSIEKMALTSNGFTLEADIFSNAMKTGYRVEQIPISYRARPDGSQSKLKVWDGLKIGWFLIKKKYILRG